MRLPIANWWAELNGVATRLAYQADGRAEYVYLTRVAAGAREHAAFPPARKIEGKTAPAPPRRPCGQQEPARAPLVVFVINFYEVYLALQI
jgi:hypothetical protein